MGGATRFMTLLTTPFPPFRPSLTILRRGLFTTPLRRITISYPSKIKTLTPQLVSSFHSQPNNYISNSYPIQATASQQQQEQNLLQQHPWPEWTNFLSFLSNLPEEHNIVIPDEDAFVVYEELPDHFVRAASACLAFARARPNLLGLLSRIDIEAVVTSGTPFLFKSALDAASRMRAFLGTGVSESDQATTVDLMKYILSYASNIAVPSERNRLHSKELVDLSVRNLLHEMVIGSSGAPAGYMPASDNQFPGGQRQTFRPLGQNIVMKRGDWICSKCDFMNFAKNMKCLECEESRPKKQITGGEWDCPQCNFYNYGRNTVCLRCDCRRPGAPLFQATNSSSDQVYNRDYTNTVQQQSAGTKFSPLPQSGSSNSQYPQRNDGNKVLSSDFRNQPMHREPQVNFQVQQNSVNVTYQNKETEQAVKSENWFKKMTELHEVKDLPGAVSDDDFPDIMPMRKGENRFVVSKKKDRSLISPKFKRQAAMEQTDNSNFVPFVPFPPGYFSKNNTEQPNNPDPPVKPTSDSRNENQSMSQEIVETSRSSAQISISSSNINNNTSSGGVSLQKETNGGVSLQNENVRSTWEGKSLEGSQVKETDPLDMSEEAKAERWFKRVAQIKDISELSQIPDEDFPSIMPMRKGVNRFVVSKRKTPLERRLTSQQYRRNLPIVTNNDVVKRDSDSS